MGKSGRSAKTFSRISFIGELRKTNLQVFLTRGEGQKKHSLPRRNNNWMEALNLAKKHMAKEKVTTSI